MIMQNMMDVVGPRLAAGPPVLVETVEADGVPEGAYAEGLEAIARAHDGVSVGSYPAFTSGGIRNQIVLRSRDAALLSRAAQATRAMIESLSKEFAR
jgi:molybdopterin-biosynthesis enzyme MoeA-like protein